MKKKLIKKAKLLGFGIYENCFDKLTIKGFIDKETWSIKEEGLDIWLISTQENPLMVVGTETALKFLERFS